MPNKKTNEEDLRAFVVISVGRYRHKISADWQRNNEETVQSLPQSNPSPGKMTIFQGDIFPARHPRKC